MSNDIHTTTITVIEPAELERVQGLIDDLRADKAALLGEVAALQDALEACQASHEPPPPPPPVGRQRLYVDGRTLRRKDGTPVRCGIESMFADGLQDPTLFFARQKAAGADIVSPLPQGRWMQGALDVAQHQRIVAATSGLGLVLGYNADHMHQDGVGQNGRDWLCRPEVVAMLNACDACFIEVEVETGWDQTAIAWRDDVIAMVLQLRAAGHLNPIKVGSPDGGRSPRRALEMGAQVVAADPLHQVIFTWQRYWGLQTSGWTYQGHNGVAHGLPGSLAMCDQIAASGLCFLVGEESRDDIGPTGFETVIPRLKQLGIIWQWWVWSNGNDPTALNGGSFGSLTPMGQTVKALLESA